ncbi:VOC family protein [Siphonobacter aquaeclarae]|uniref:PhnB protein n=1 Tax=Siphonobacter aquaeclarae TaxID=563176 RepID=A0A1G9HX97_9BACT|nr:VOC family protein [Siphonobacter aquaeclarae]SDL17445.1 PhnB protein [Siphonobacter aquaeclarae]
MAIFNSYLNFNGTTEEAFRFYQSVLGGEFLTLERFSDTPEADRLRPEDRDKIMHISLPLGNGNILMGTDALESMGHPLTVGNNFYLSVQAESKEEAHRLFDGLSAGGIVKVPLGRASWGAYFGMFDDKFGIQWMVHHDE